MAGRQFSSVLHHMCGAFGPRSQGALGDAHLLERWVAQRDELAFELLLRRHGPMVFALCRRLLGRTQDAEDAFQATFLVLVRRAGAIQKQAALGSWLYKVAYRVALRARQRCGAQEEALADVAAPGLEPADELLWRELRPVLDEEVRRLPPRYRDVFVLCQLQGKSNEEAARELGCPLGTVHSRLSRAREQLRCRLMRRGVTTSTPALLTLLAEQVQSAPLPPLLAGLTVKHVLIGTGASGVPQIPAAISSLCQGVLQAMFVTKLKIAATLLLVLVLSGATGGYVMHQVQAQGPGEGEGPGSAVQVVDTKTSSTEWKATKEVKAPIDGILFLDYAAGKLQALSGKDGALHLWSVLEDNGIANLTGHTQSVTQAAFSPDGQYLFSAGMDGVLFIRDAGTGKIYAKIQQPAPITALAISPDGKLVAGASATDIRFWAVPTGKEVGAPKATPNKVNTLKFSADGKFLAAGGSDKVVLLWTMPAGQVLLLQQPASAKVIAFAPDGTTLVLGGSDGVIRFVDVASGKIIREIKGHTAAIVAVVFAPDGKVLASSAKDDTVRLWDVASGKQVALGKQDAPAGAMAISPDAKVLISSGKDGVIKLWDVHTGKALSADKAWIYIQPPDRLGLLVKDLIQRQKSDEECVEALFLATLGRFPAATEMTLAKTQLGKDKAKRQTVLEDLVFVLTNTKEFNTHLQHLKGLGQAGPAQEAWKKPGTKAASTPAIDLDKAKAPLSWAPLDVDFGTISAGKPTVREVKIQSAQPFRILSVKGTANTFECEWKDAAVAAHVLKITVTPKQAGEFTAKLAIVTDRSGSETLLLSVQAKVEP